MTRVLFVCHGNICRSVSAHYILQDMIDKRGLSTEFQIDSAATSTEEIGNAIYPPMRAELEHRGIPIGNHRARQVKRSDYDAWDYIIAMDSENLYYLDRILGGDPEEKVHYLMSYTGDDSREIEDPWYTRKFALCVDEITEGCEALLESLISASQI